MSMRRMGLMALVLAGGMAVAACGGSTQQEAPADTSSSTSDMGGASGPVNLGTTKTLDTFVFEPNAWETSAGAETTITLDNSTGTQEHSWVLLNAGLTRDDALIITDDDTDKFSYNFKVDPGQTEADTFTAPAVAGDYVIVCTIPGHAAGGMLGTLTVK